MKTIKKVGVLELCNTPASSLSEHLVGFLERKQYVGATPQAVAVWCRQLGYDTYYATYYGTGDPRDRLPRDLDLVFISTYSCTAPLACALSKAYRIDRVRTVCGGPHAKSFPRDALRHFDLVVLDCDKNLIADILHDRFAPQSIVSSPAPYADLPTIEERLPEIQASVFWGGRPFAYSFVPMLSSAGCPYSCNFCAEWDRPYRALSRERVAEDLRFASAHLPGVWLFFGDPNFGVHFDETLATFESLPVEQRSPYIMQTSLTNVRQPGRLQRLRESHCVGIGPGIESWTENYQKIGRRSSTPFEKMTEAVEQMHTLHEYIPFIQVNFMFGLDSDFGDEPFELTKEFLRRTPYLYPTLNVPVAFGGTPLYRDLLKERRILKAMPFSFYWAPYLTLILKNYDALAYFRHMADLYALLASGEMVRRRLASNAPRSVKALNVIYRDFATRVHVAKFRKLVHRLETDRDFRLFHAGQSRVLPPDYVRMYQQHLGSYAELMPIEASQPMFEDDEGPAVCLSRQDSQRIGPPASPKPAVTASEETAWPPLDNGVPAG